MEKLSENTKAAARDGWDDSAACEGEPIRWAIDGKVTTRNKPKARKRAIQQNNVARKLAEWQIIKTSQLDLTVYTATD